jgi:hypothetical protein
MSRGEGDNIEYETPREQTVHIMPLQHRICALLLDEPRNNSNQRTQLDNRER